MSAATEFLADIMDIRAHIKTLAAKDAEVDFRKRDPIDSVTIHVDEPRLPLGEILDFQVDDTGVTIESGER